VHCCIVDRTEFRDWDTFVAKFAKDKLESVKKWQIFKVSDKGKGVMTKLSSNLPDATKEEEYFYTDKITTNQRDVIIYNVYPSPLYQQSPGLRPIKQMELYIKFRPLIREKYWSDICPEPSQEVQSKFRLVKIEKGRKKREEKKANGGVALGPRKKQQQNNQ
jgi:hypothetical protein